MASSEEFSEENMMDILQNSWEDSSVHNLRYTVACFKFASLVMPGNVIKIIYELRKNLLILITE